MALLDWLKSRNAAQQESVAQKAQDQKPETAREMYTRQEAQQKSGPPAMERISAKEQTKVNAVKERLKSATQHLSSNTPASAPAPADNGSREAMRQNMTGQEKSAPALSPTSAQAGKPEEKGAPAPSQGYAKTPEKPSQPQQPTLPRRPPSWER